MQPGGGLLNVRSLTCYRLKNRVLGQRVKGFEEYIDFQGRQVITHGPVQGRNFEAVLFISPGHRQDPPWADFIHDGFEGITIRQTTSTAAALVVRVTLPRKHAFFAFPFGAGGRFLLQPGVWERGYGLRTALNLIYPRGVAFDEGARLVSIDAKRRGADTVRSRRQTVRATAFETFGVDRLRDVLNAATGRPADAESWGRRISGGDALHMSTEDIRFGEIEDVCHRVDEVHRRTDYRERFSWLDNIQPVADSDLREGLQRRVLEMLRSGATEDLDLGPPEIVDWERVESFRYHFDTRQSVTHPDLRLVDYLRGAKQHAPLDDVDVPALRRRRIEALDGDGQVVHHWTVWRCLDGEVTLDGETFILDDGEFFQVEASFLAALNAYIEGISPGRTELPSARKTTSERTYNYAAASGNTGLLLLDRQLVVSEGSTTRIEVCDLLSDGHELIHVKRHLGARDLSHLFAQGATSAELLQTDTEFRARVQALVTKLGSRDAFAFFDGALRTSDFEVSYAIIADWRGRQLAKALPFFSKVNLRRAAEELRSRGFGVSCSQVLEVA